MAGKPDMELFQFTDETFPRYPSAFITSLLEQYRLFVLSADNASARREASNRYLVTLSVAIIALYGLQSTTGPVNLYLLIPLAISGVVVSLLSMTIIKSHQKLNKAKFEVIHQLEERLPAIAFKYEWEMLKSSERGESYWEISGLQQGIHWVFLALHVTVIIWIALSLVDCSLIDLWRTAWALFGR